MDEDPEDDEDLDVEILLPSTGAEPDDIWFDTDDPAGWQPRATDPEWWSADADPLELSKRDERNQRSNRDVRIALVALVVLAVLGTVANRLLDGEDETVVSRASQGGCVAEGDHMELTLWLEGDDPHLGTFGNVEFVDRSSLAVIEQVPIEDPGGDERRKVVVRSTEPAPAEFDCRIR